MIRLLLNLIVIDQYYISDNLSNRLAIGIDIQLQIYTLNLCTTVYYW